MEIKLAERLKTLRQRDGIAQAGLAIAIGTDQAFIGHIETGKSLVSIETLVLLANHFKVSTDYLLGLTNNPEPYN